MALDTASLVSRLAGNPRMRASFADASSACVTVPPENLCSSFSYSTTACTVFCATIPPRAEKLPVRRISDTDERHVGDPQGDRVRVRGLEELPDDPHLRLRRSRLVQGDDLPTRELREGRKR